MKRYFSIILVLLLLRGLSAHGQDPSFSQFFSSPLNINPGLTGIINADWRAISNLRNQWITPASPYMTGTISFDTRLTRDAIAHVVSDENFFSIGTMLMYDRAMAGVVKGTYASVNLAYNLKVLENEGYTHRFSLGFGGIYGRRYIDYSRVDFEEQFAGYGFNTNLPTGESSLSNMKGYFSLSAGAVYSIKSNHSNFDLGISSFHINTPNQTFLQDENQELAPRKVIHSNFEYKLNEGWVINANGIFQKQAEASYFSVGGGLGHILGDAQNTILNAGVWYWSDNAIIPYVGLAYNNWQFGLSYDITTSKLTQASFNPGTWELSIIIRGKRGLTGVIPCPWK
jgi:type IX secretion system PorP/SprF family membrane protein